MAKLHDWGKRVRFEEQGCSGILQTRAKKYLEQPCLGSQGFAAKIGLQGLR